MAILSPHTPTTSRRRGFMYPCVVHTVRDLSLWGLLAVSIPMCMRPLALGASWTMLLLWISNPICTRPLAMGTSWTVAALFLAHTRSLVVLAPVTVTASFPTRTSIAVGTSGPLASPGSSAAAFKL
ncbi:hypothetical protein PoB_005081700 [Plakobranchus ocellatus]|uniref:Uncharacterized protein n=1 Tax=Plakobranchus ocellatus TaxID=259542 RepID=A0AAV4BYB3_9GAST|nr:hypothetical protein PoB_005081700 [Plakobranchus ocellatus]